MPPRVTDGRARPRFLAGFLYLVVPALKPFLKQTLGRNERIWRKLRAIRDRHMVGPSMPVGLEAPFTRRLYAAWFHLLGPASRVVLKNTLGRNRWMWGKLRAVHNRLIHGSPQRGALPRAVTGNVQPVDGHPRPFGVNVAGYLNSEKGTGEAARSAIAMLKAANVPLVLNNIIDSSSVNNETEFTDFSADNPYAFNLVCVSADQAANFAWHKGGTYFQGRYNIGLWNWELTSFPEEWLPCLQYFDEIWVPSNFVLNVLSPVSPIPVLRFPYSVRPESDRRDDLERSRFGLSNEHFFFLFMFDFHSFFERKNPLGLIEAFKRAFRKDDDVVLAIKSVHADTQAVRAMREAAKQTNVKVTDTVLSRQEVNALYHLCDCYVSLHRSEGFGLTLAEAMRSAKPVIGTAYGGNTDFMTPENSYPVKYKLIEIDRDHGPYKKGSVWADPELDHATELMRHVYENREEARAIGCKAREDILRLLHPRVVGDSMKQRLLTIASLKEITVPSLEDTADQTTIFSTREAM